MKVRREAKWIPSINLESTDPRSGSRYHHCCISIDAAYSTSRSRGSDVKVDHVRHTALSVLDTLGEPFRGLAIHVRSGEKEVLVCDQKDAEESNATSITKSSSTSSLTSTEDYVVKDLEAEDKDPTPSYASYSSDSRRLTPVPPDADRDVNRSKLAAFLFDSIDTDTDDDDLFLPTTTIDINYKAASISSKPREGGVKVPITRHVPSRMLWEL